MSKTVLVEVRDHVATVTLNRPEASNALSLDLGRELLAAALRCEADPEVRAVVVTGAGKHFCFGGDLRGMAEQGEGVAGYLNELTTAIHAAITAFTRMRAPVIAAVNGTAAGGGIGLMCMTDLAVGGRSSKFSLAYTGVALAPDCSTSFLLPRIVGRRRALELMLLNRTLSAEEALQWGLLNQVVEDAEVLPAALALAARLAAGPTGSFGAVKRLIEAADSGLESQMALEGRTIAQQATTAEGREGVGAFLGKRKAQYT
ncbi:MAG TPA: enoyl-CoA hydratase/isomerase family protein [Steroidobacteraceae bacterium]|nr:enoyl-CoA hydratase/isomerase family protein [Steroidobacteraceae bacterium]